MYQQQMNQQGMRQNQQNPQSYQTQQNPQSRQNQHCQLTDQDLLNTVLAEMRRISREYTTAILEASNPSIRENFYSLLDRTLQDQELVYTMMENMNMYGPRSTASQKEIQKEEQQHRQRANELQFFLQQNLGQGSSPSMNNQPNPYDQPYEQMQQFQPNLYNQQYIPFTQNQGNPFNAPSAYGQFQESQPNLQNQQNPWGVHNQQYSQNQYPQNPQNPQNQQFQQGQQYPQYPQYPQNQHSQNINEREAGTNKEAAQSSETAPSEYSTPATNMYQSAANKTDFNTTGSRQANSHTTGAASTQQSSKKPKASK